MLSFWLGFINIIQFFIALKWREALLEDVFFSIENSRSSPVLPGLTSLIGL